MIADVHCHLNSLRFEKDLDQVIERAKAAGVRVILTSGVNHTGNLKALELQKKYDIVKASLGLYPIDALKKEAESGESEDFPRDIEPIDVEKELKFIEKNKDNCIAIGEVGMDFFWDQDHKKEQRENFQKVITLVEKIRKPVIIHSRKAEFEAVDMLESSNIKKVVMHCFCGRKHLVKRGADNGWYFTIPPSILRMQNFQIMAEIVNINQLLTETDAPYQSPYPGKRNEPAFITETIKKIAEIKRMTVEDTENNLFMNYQQIFL